jgi:hypothetical protein
LAEQRAREEAERELARQNAERAAAQKKREAITRWNRCKLTQLQKACHERGIWPGGDKPDLHDRLVRRLGRSMHACMRVLRLVDGQRALKGLDTVRYHAGAPRLWGEAPAK